MAKIHTIVLNPPVLNSSSYWASSRLQLEELYACVWTGGVTTRTATLLGFAEDSSTHKHALMQGNSSINSYGYSPLPLSQYLTWIRDMLVKTKSTKPFIISIAPASTDELSQMLEMIQALRRELSDANSKTSRIAIELNTSCPNIEGYPPPAYAPQSLQPLLEVFRRQFVQDPTLTIGLKLAPFVHVGQFQSVVDLLANISDVSHSGEKVNCVSFLSCTNTLGSSVVFEDQTTVKNVVPGESSTYAVPAIIGGLAGDAIHPLSLGNVHSFKKLLSEHPDLSLRNISIIGIGGVTSKEAVRRMICVGASAVGCATALGTHGVGVFERLIQGL
ncbi:hypothetical protein BU17DRAFT_42136 [Hysterangium stoloniferum]|nr:hypothetical protein BU17DRAFT_42136 [Hysterangium stoloniferum]